MDHARLRHNQDVPPRGLRQYKTDDLHGPGGSEGPFFGQVGGEHFVSRRDETGIPHHPM